MRSPLVKIQTRRVVDQQALYREVGKRIQQQRKAARMSQDELAVALGLTRVACSNLERGANRILLEHVYNAALLFGVSPSRFLP